MIVTKHGDSVAPQLPYESHTMLYWALLSSIDQTGVGPIFPLHGTFPLSGIQDWQESTEPYRFTVVPTGNPPGQPGPYFSPRLLRRGGQLGGYFL